MLNYTETYKTNYWKSECFSKISPPVQSVYVTARWKALPRSHEVENESTAINFRSLICCVGNTQIHMWLDPSTYNEMSPPSRTEQHVDALRRVGEF